MIDSDYPRVLILSASKYYTLDNQTSITLNSFFGSWPKERIAQVVCGVFNETKSGKLDNNIYILSLDNIPFLRKIFNKQRNSKSIGESALSIIPERASLLFKLRHSLKLFLISNFEFFPYKMNDDLIDFISKFQPDIIYTTLESPRIIKLVDSIEKYNPNYKIVPHFLDDWPNTMYKSHLTFFHRLILKFELKKILDKSKACFCISERMCQEYIRRYGKPIFYPLMNCVQEYQFSSIDKNNTSDVISLCYTGGLHLKRDEVIIDLLNNLSFCENIKLDFQIFTHESTWKNYSKRFSRFPFVKYGGYLKTDDIVRKLNEFDILVFIESFDENIINFTRFSISTKIPEYLSVGRKILAIGPSESGSIEYLKKNNAAFVLNNLGDIDYFLQFFKNMIYSNEFKIVQVNARNLFFRNHIKAGQIKLVKDTFNRLIAN